MFWNAPKYKDNNNYSVSNMGQLIIFDCLLSSQGTRFFQKDTAFQ